MTFIGLSLNHGLIAREPIDRHWRCSRRTVRRHVVLHEIRNPLLTVVDRDMARRMSAASSEHGHISSLWRIAVGRDDNRPILQQSWTPVLRVDWMTTRIHPTGFKCFSAIGCTLLKRTILCMLIGVVGNGVFVDWMARRICRGRSLPGSTEIFCLLLGLLLSSNSAALT